MSTEHLSLGIAFIAGLASFLSPCVLSLAPGYIGIITGVHLDTGEKPVRNLRLIVASTLLFILGFSLVFILMGSAATMLGGILRTNRQLLGKISGVVIIIFGLHMSGLLPVKLLYRQAGFRTIQIRYGYLRSFVTGIAFGFGWTPCVGPILGSILLMAGNTMYWWQGSLLLSAYTLGLAVPFFLLAIFLGYGISLFKKWGRYAVWIEKGAGILLVILGLLIYFGRLYMISFF